MGALAPGNLLVTNVQKEGTDMPKTVAEVLEMATKVQMVDLRFTDLPGVWQHFTIPAHVLEADTFENGIPFDGSSIRGFKEIHESDMLLMLDPSTAFVDPIFEIPTLVLIGDVFDPFAASDVAIEGERLSIAIQM